MPSFYSHGKLLITGEYLVLDGARALALPTVFGQDLVVGSIASPQLLWHSLDHQGKAWLEVTFDLPSLRLLSTTYTDAEAGAAGDLAEKLRALLLAARQLQPAFLSTDKGFSVTTHLSFPRNWGLGTSSTLVNNLANWAGINPYELLAQSFGGSGYDLACAAHDGPILYERTGLNPRVSPVTFDPPFKDRLYFVHLNKKQNSQAGIVRYEGRKGATEALKEQVNALTDALLTCTSLSAFESLLVAHEALIAKTLQLPPVQQRLFSDYFGQTKSLGAWGGDFILATGNEDSPAYFNAKGFYTVIPYQKMIRS